jgi:hypothetical protein
MNNEEIPYYPLLGDYIADEKPHKTSDYIIFIKISKKIKEYLSDIENYKKVAKVETITHDKYSTFINRVVYSVDRLNHNKLISLYEIFQKESIEIVIDKIINVYNKKK